MNSVATTTSATVQTQQLSAAQQKAAKELKTACQDFESIFISMIFRQMMDSIPKSGESSVSGSGIMNSFGDQAVAQQISRQGGFGVADALYKDMVKLVIAQADSGKTAK